MMVAVGQRITVFPTSEKVSLMLRNRGSASCTIKSFRDAQSHAYHLNWCGRPVVEGMPTDEMPFEKKSKNKLARPP